MRKFLILMLLAGAATPALASGEQDSPRRSGRAERAQSDGDAPRRDAPTARPQRNSSGGDNVNRSDNGGRRAFGGGAPATVESPQSPRNAAGDTVRNWRQGSGGTPVARVRKSEDRPTLPDRPAAERRNGALEGSDTVRNWRRVDRRGNDGPAATIEDRVRPAPAVQEGGLVQPRRPLPRVLDADRRISRTPVFGTEPPAPRTADSREALSGRRWNTSWHRDSRYDWRDWRRRHHSRFRLGFYYDPFGWDYFRYGIGWRLWPSYYRSNYWLNDASYYRLPPAYGPYRWIRYHNDALLVNIYSGQVVDVIYDFFW